MDKSLVGLLAVASAFAVPAQAATAPPLTVDNALQASSYADLLKPIPNAVAQLAAVTAARADEAAGVNAEGQLPVEQVQFCGTITIITTIIAGGIGAVITTTIITITIPDQA